MAEPTPTTSREERLAQQLRANLRRRKVQARELAEQPAPPPSDQASDPLAGTEAPG